MTDFGGAVKFPRRRGDGTFTVLAYCTVSAPEVVPLVGAYVNAWVEANRRWVRIWRSNVITVEHLELAADFVKDPQVEKAVPGSLCVVFEGSATSTRWKDWAVRLIDEVCKVFPEVLFERFESR